MNLTFHTKAVLSNKIYSLQKYIWPLLTLLKDLYFHISHLPASNLAFHFRTNFTGDKYKIDCYWKTYLEYTLSSQTWYEKIIYLHPKTEICFIWHYVPRHLFLHLLYNLSNNSPGTEALKSILSSHTFAHCVHAFSAESSSQGKS